jgi:hypothetical protein
MRTPKAVLAAALIAGAVIPAASADAHTAHSGRAHAAGGDPPPVLPASVRVRIRRGENALDKAGTYVDKGEPDKAINSLRGVRANMYAAWRGAVYTIQNAPPPADDAKAIAHTSQDPVGPIYATPEETAVAVLGFQHDVVSFAYGLVDDAKGTLRDSLSVTMFAAMDRRDSAIAFIHSITPPATDAKAIAQAADDPVGFDVLMPGIVPDLDDEQAQGKELIQSGALTPGEKRIVRLADAQSAATEATLNSYWPPATDA